MSNDFQKRAKIRRGATVATIIIVIAAVILIDRWKNGNSVALNAAPIIAQTPSDSTLSTTQSSAQFKDGTYSANSQYAVPHSYESIKVTLTVKGGVVTSSQVQNSEGDRDSAMFQQEFASEYQSFVVGKSLSSLDINIIAGASDTTAGFNQAVSSIRSQAQA